MLLIAPPQRENGSRYVGCSAASTCIRDRQLSLGLMKDADDGEKEMEDRDELLVVGDDDVGLQVLLLISWITGLYQIQN